MQLATYRSSKASADVSAPVKCTFRSIRYLPSTNAAGLSFNPAMEFEERNRRQMPHVGY